MKVPIFIFAAIFLTATSVKAIDEDLVKEKKCKEVNLAPDFDWMGSVNKWYIPMWSKFYKYRTAQHMIERESSKISKSEVEAACLVYLKDGWITGFNQRRKWNVTSDGKSFTFRASWPQAQAGHFKFETTNNKNFLLGVTCWDDGDIGWAVMSTKTVLEQCDKDLILARVKSLGFNEKFIVEENYETCDDEDEKAEIKPNCAHTKDSK